MTKHDVYITGNDSDILYKKRPSIVLLYLPGHYELIGIMESKIDSKNTGKTIKTLFEPNHQLIEAIRKRYNELLHRRGK